MGPRPACDLSLRARIGGSARIDLDEGTARASSFRPIRGTGAFSTLGTVLATIRSLYAEPRVPHAPGPMWRDRLLAVVFVPVALAESILRTDLVWPVPSAVVCLIAIVLLAWRRVHPLPVVLAVFGLIDVTDIASLVADVRWEGAYTTAVVLLFPYSLLRWGSGREAAIGLPFMVAGAVFTVLTDDNAVGDAIGGTIVLLFPAAVGAVVRYENVARDRLLDQAKSQEREEIARELHDTVAHHVSAIAIQAQAGLALSGDERGPAVDALQVIEEEASRTLSEMRAMVGALRRGDEPEFAPQPGVADIRTLAATPGVELDVAVTLSGEVHDLRPAVDTAVYRLAQESLTNAARHARDATRVTVDVVGAEDHVRLTIRDDGRAGPTTSNPGFGLVGMRERASLLGGSLDAGPMQNGGWSVVAVLPRDGGRP